MNRVLIKDRYKFALILIFSFRYQQILSVASTISADFDTTFVRLVILSKKCLILVLRTKYE